MTRQFRELVRTFFRKFVQNDLIALNGDTRATLVNILAVLAAPGVFFTLLENLAYASMYPHPLWWRDLMSMAEKGLYVNFSATVLGIVTVLEWDSLLPDRRDYQVLGPLPIHTGAILAAKVAALAGFWTLFTVTINAFSVAGFPSAVIQTEGWRTLVWFMRAHAIAVLSANAFVFLAVLAAQGLLMNLLGWRWFRKVSPWAQFVLIAGLLLLFFSSVGVAGRIDPARPFPRALYLFPTAWFVGLYQTQLGWTQPVFRELAGCARTALAIAGCLAVATFALSYRRHVRRSLEAQEAPGAAPGAAARLATRLLDNVILRNPAERVAFHFVRQTTLRSRQHRGILAAWAGAGFGLVFQSLAGVVASGKADWWRQESGVLLPVPLVITFFTVCGLRHVFTIPAELKANQVFRLCGTGDAMPYRSGVWKAAVLLGVAPVLALLLPAYVAAWGWQAAIVQTVFGFTVGCILVDVLLAGFAKVPYTCSYVPGKANVKSLWSVYLVAFLAWVALFSRLGYLMLRQPSRLVWLAVLAAGCRVGVRLYQRDLEPEDRVLIFDEVPQPAVQTLNIGRI